MTYERSQWMKEIVATAALFGLAMWVGYLISGVVR